MVILSVDWWMAPMVCQPIGIRIKQARLERGWSRSELAKRIGVSLTAIAKWERGESEPKYRHIVKLLSVFRMPSGWLFDNFDM